MGILDQFSLEGKTAIVTGAGQGIGKAVANAFSEAGANVTLAGINIDDREASEVQLRAVADQIATNGRRTLPFVTDVRNAAQVQAMIEATVNEFGGVDTVANVVGGMFPINFMELFLASDASSYVNGVTLLADGGSHMLGGEA